MSEHKNNDKKNPWRVTGKESMEDEPASNPSCVAAEQSSRDSPLPEPEQQIQELKELLQRTQANFENYRKQMEKRMEEIQQFAAKSLIMELLPILDNFELALKHQQNLTEFSKGMELIHAQFSGLLDNHGLKAFSSVGQKYDPYFHEALLKVDSELPENIVVEEFQKGYTLHAKVIRHARVKISSGKKSVQAEDEEIKAESINREEIKQNIK